MKNKQSYLKFRKVIITLLATSSLLPNVLIANADEVIESELSAESEIVSDDGDKLELLLDNLELELNKQQIQILSELLHEDKNELTSLLTLLDKKIKSLDIKDQFLNIYELLEGEELSDKQIEIIHTLDDLNNLPDNNRLQEESIDELTEKEFANEALEDETINESSESEDSQQPAIQVYSLETENETDEQAEIMYKEVINASNATNAWNAALEYIRIYPNHTTLSEAVNDAAQRVYSMGKSNERNGNISSAIYYYNLIKDEKWVSTELQTGAVNSYNNLQVGRMYTAVINSPNATSAWNAAVTYLDEFPNHPKLLEALNHAAGRIYSMGQSRLRNKDYSNANYYFGLIIDQELVTESLRNKSLKNFNDVEGNASYTNVINAQNASMAWNNALEFKKNFPNHSRLSDAVNHAAKRIYSMGLSRQRNKDLANAIYYYELIKDEPIIEGSFQSQISKNHSEVIEAMNIDEIKRELNKVINAPNASSAWTAALEFKEKYPGNSKLAEAFDSAGTRIFNMGVSSHKSNKYELASTYYLQLINEPSISNSMKSKVKNNLEKASKGLGLLTAAEMYDSVLNAPNATSAWTRLTDFSQFYPNDNRLNIAVDSAAGRILSLGVSHHKNGRYANAGTYYRQLVNSDLIKGSMANKVNELLKLANNGTKLISESQYSKEVSIATSASQAWNIAVEGINLYPNDSRISKSLNDAANRNLKLGRSYQRKGNYSQASIYYNRVLSEKRVSNSIQTLSKVFLNQLEETHQRVVYIDPGHGGRESGAVNQRYNVQEKVLNINTSKYLKEELESRGYIVLMSREDDTYVGLTARAIEANDAFADIFVSVHYNAMGGNYSGTANGIETFIHHTVQNKDLFGQETNKNNFLTENPRIDESLRLAENVHEKLIQNTSMYDRGVKGNNFNVLRNTAIPAVLLELGFMDNNTEFNKIRQANYQKIAAKAVADGIDTYFKTL